MGRHWLDRNHLRSAESLSRSDHAHRNVFESEERLLPTIFVFCPSASFVLSRNIPSLVCGISSCSPLLNSRGNIVVVYPMRYSRSAQVLKHNVSPEIWMKNCPTTIRTTPTPTIEEWLMMVLCLIYFLDGNGSISSYFCSPLPLRIIRRLTLLRAPSIHVSASWVSRPFQHADHRDFWQCPSLTFWQWSDAFMPMIECLI